MNNLTGRLKILKFGSQALADLLKEKRYGRLLEVTKGIPQDAELVKIQPTSNGVYNLIFKSSQFDLVKETEPIPTMDQVELKSYEKNLLEEKR